MQGYTYRTNLDSFTTFKRCRKIELTLKKESSEYPGAGKILIKEIVIEPSKKHPDDIVFVYVPKEVIISKKNREIISENNVKINRNSGTMPSNTIYCPYNPYGAGYAVPIWKAFNLLNYILLHGYADPASGDWTLISEGIFPKTGYKQNKQTGKIVPKSGKRYAPSARSIRSYKK